MAGEPTTTAEPISPKVIPGGFKTTEAAFDAARKASLGIKETKPLTSDSLSGVTFGSNTAEPTVHPENAGTVNADISTAQSQATNVPDILSAQPSAPETQAAAPAKEIADTVAATELAVFGSPEWRRQLEQKQKEVEASRARDEAAKQATYPTRNAIAEKISRGTQEEVIKFNNFPKISK